MKKIKNLFLLLSELSGGRWAIAVISALFPIMIMMGFGVFLAIKYGYVLELSILIAASTLIISVPLYLLGRASKSNKPKITSAPSEIIEDGLVKASTDWSQNEMLIWEKSKTHSRTLIIDKSEWNQINEVGLAMMEFVATEFDKKALDFSIPEGLQLFEEISRRYKLVVKEYIPIVDILKISHLKAGYDAFDKYGELGQKLIKAAVWANHAKNAYMNPAKLAIDLVNQQSTSGMTKGFVDEMQLNAKQALLDEIVSVAIDLYSGRFSFEESEVTESSVAEKDEQRIAPELEPIRIVMVGQTSAGKSSIINVLKEDLVAEVDVLPSTDGTTVYNAQLDDMDIRVVDLQGLDGNQKTEQSMLSEMTQADLIVWVLKANQSARELDKTLNAKFNDYYQNGSNISRKKPAVICVVNQVDKLKPINEWTPPYNLDEPTTAKGKIINQALAYNQKLLMPDSILALSIAPQQNSFGVDELKQTIRHEIANANNVQRNRQRMEVAEKGVGIKKQLGRAFKSSKRIAPSALKMATPSLIKMAIKKVVK
ncbi:GTPase family protein [Psychromonas sp. Urea-02u-13]|uniref:GTPase family protein n=1 Tax=Psychromonas sp. Urea-02u-13 TaxID=2058326 RepID=UPI000C322B35|nr:GTPase [Psychromonas sp. Urea-02u-13]PKG38339.1 GTP-binding protein [Psychromonas sp. Urea-02u-13]